MTGLHRPIAERFADKFIPEPMSGCWLWTGAVQPETGYGALNRVGGVVGAHRLSWELHRGPIPYGLHVLHKCDIRSCVNPDHLFLGTNKDNIDDMKRKGRDRHRGPQGEAHPRAKLTVTDVLAIRADKRGPTEIARELSVSTATIEAIRSRRNWRHVP